MARRCFTGVLTVGHSIYPSWWNRTATIYNKVTEDGKLRYYKHTVKGCYFGTQHVFDSDAGNASAVSENVLRVRKSALYINPAAYQALGSADKAAYFTLRPGDVVLYGDIADDMADEQGKRPADILKKRRGFVVKTSADNTQSQIMPHYRAGG